MPTTGRNYSGGQRVNFESTVSFSKCLRAKIYSNVNVYFDAQSCQTLLLKESDPLLFCLGSWTTCRFKALRPGEVRKIWYQNKAGHLIYRLGLFMAVYNVPGVFAEHLNHMGVGRLLSSHLQHMAAAFTLLI